MDILGHVGIVSPLALLSVAALGPLAVFVVWRARVQQHRRSLLGIEGAHRPALGLACAMLPALLMSLALLRPYLGRETVQVPSAENDYMFLVDVSRSMLARDVPPSRMGLAKRKMKDIIRAFMKEGSPHRFGITVFAGGVYSICPLTDDTAVVEQFIDVIGPDLVSSLGSNLEEGMITAVERFTGARSRDGRILLISDGEDNLLNVEKVIGVIKGAHIPVDVLGVGTTVGSPIEIENGRFVRDKNSSIVHSKLNEPSLELIAKAGDGVYVRATLGDEDVSTLVSADSPIRVHGERATREITTYREVGGWFALAALVALLLVAVIRRNSFALTAVLLSSLLARDLSAETPTAIPSAVLSARAAFELYNEGKFAEALHGFTAALEADPGNRALEQAVASAQFKLGEYAKAQESFRKLADSATTGRSYFENTFNEGNALLALKRYQDAIEAYTKALDVKPDDEQAVHNRSIARRLLEESKHFTPTPTNTPTPTPPSPSSASPSPSPQPSPSAAPSPSPSPSAQPSPSAAPSALPSGAPSPSPDPSSQPTPQSSPSPSSQGTPDGSPTPDADKQDRGGERSPTAGATPSPEATRPADAGDMPEATPTGRQKEAADEDTLTPPAPSSQQAAGPLDPSLREAEAWLRSLPDTPLMLRRDKSKKQNQEQTW